MPKFRVTVTEQVTVTYPAVTIEAADEEEARSIAEEMRDIGELGNPHDYECVEDVDIWVR